MHVLVYRYSFVFISLFSDSFLLKISEECHRRIKGMSDPQGLWFFDIKLIFLNLQCDILALNFKMQSKSQNP
jgi:hypothetical protein